MGAGVGGGILQTKNGHRYKTNSLFFSFLFFKSTNQESVETESRVCEGWEWGLLEGGGL